ncbi:MAG: protein kinase [Planctomycetaceae bacterium]|nr:protein kinase [Planctomycetaceae bacterium]
MRFRCPNCLQQVRIDDSADATEETQDVITCPSCHSQFNLISQEDTEIAIAAGQRIDHFEIRRMLGEGTFGAVYLAWDTELERQVALKIPRGRDLRGDSSKLFLREARAAAAIAHPNVVSVHEIGQHNDSIYIACQYIEGITLREFLRAYPISFEEMARLLIRILNAIAFFHDKQIIHRDIKPGNILLDGSNEPYVADFGLARRELPDEVTVTKSGHIVGTIGYMAPEQARGEVQSLSGRTDVYAVGVILYEMLTERRPFTAGSSHTVLHHILHTEPKPPRRINPKVPRDLQTICLKALEKSQEDRYQSAREMADDLQRFVDNKPIIARPASVLDIAVKTVRRNRLTSFLLVLTAAVIGWSTLQSGTPPAGSIAVQISVSDPTAKILWERYDDFLLIPHRSQFKAQGRSGETTWVIPGFYRVSARNDKGARHVVWRTVPEAADHPSLEQLYPHSSWTIDDGRVILQPFDLFHDDDIVDATIAIRGGRASFGYSKKGIEARHVAAVDDFRIGVNEVSVARFKQVLNQPLKSGGDSTYLSILLGRFGNLDYLNDDDPIRGFHVDVARLYCELSGTRLPTCHEWEYAATNGGTTEFPSGSKAVVDSVDDWTVLSTTAATPDTTTDGIRNLYFSLGEYTDSTSMSYTVVYPEKFGLEPTVIDPRVMRQIPEMVEARGVPAELVGNVTNTQFSPKTRITVIAPSQFVQSETYQQYKWFGWRVCR